MIDSILERAQQLIQLQRYSEAEAELRNVLSQDPNRIDALSMFAICLGEQNKLDEAIIVIEGAIGKQPDNDHLLYLQGLFYFRKDKLKEAEKAIRNAIAFEPHDADYFGLLAAIKLDQKEWQQALDFVTRDLPLILTTYNA